MKKFCTVLFVAIGTASIANAGLDTVTYVDASGGLENNSGFIPQGEVSGDITGVGEVTLSDIDGGDMWNGGDQFIYLHESTTRADDFTATVRVVSQTESVDGRWGKAGIHATANLSGTASNAMTQIAAGNGSQVDGSNPVPARLAGRRQNDGTGGFESPIIATEGTEQDRDSDGNVANNVLRPDGANPTWLSLTYNEADNSFVAGTALDVGGMPGVWSYSAPETAITPGDAGWYVGLAYSAHNDMDITTVPALHGVVFDNFSIVPEPGSTSLLLLSLAGLIGVLRRPYQ